MLGTCFHPTQQGQQWTVSLKVYPRRLVWEVTDLGERSKCVVLRDEWRDFVGIERNVTIEEVLCERQLGSGGVDVVHSGFGRIKLVEWW